jgi:hypothetical protein
MNTVRALRKRLGMNRKEFGVLLGVVYTFTPSVAP